MASSSQLFVMIAIVAAALLPSSLATQYIVGDDKGWTINFNYQDWAKDKVFYQGDTLVFNYVEGKHTVVKVNGSDFQHCTVPANAVTLTTGNDIVTLKTPGNKWYICGIADHCFAKMQKLVISVMPMNASPAPAPSTTSAGSGSAMSISFVVIMMIMSVLGISIV